MHAAAPRWPDVHVLPSPDGCHGLLFLTDRSRVYQVGGESWQQLVRANASSDAESVQAWLDKNLLGSGRDSESATLPAQPHLRAVSLAVAQKCNLGCVYCYAQEGNFGGPSRRMPLETALAAVERLLADASPGQSANLSFLGGEPLLNRSVLRATVERASRLAAAKGVHLTFSITTNGTLLTEDDGEFFEQHAFAVTVSLDGMGSVHDALRPKKSGGGSYERIMDNVRPLLERQRRMQVSVRVTVTPCNLALREALDAFIDMGFHSVGFSPMLASPTGRGQLQPEHFDRMLAEMVLCGLSFERAIVGARRYPFLNMVNAMKEIHAGTHRPLPCGAGATYVGVGSDGSLAACHRFVNDPTGALGSLDRGLDAAAQSSWLTKRHVDRQEPCRRCWARYLCGGGCHHEVIHRGRVACDFIRGWLHYCIEAYARLQSARPEYFTEVPDP
jgi:uncharacterized protein